MDYKQKVEEKRNKLIGTLIEFIESNPTEWEAGWYKVPAIPPFNGKTQKNYKGLNAFYLYVLGIKKGYRDPRWLTFNQTKELGGNVKNGEKSSEVFFWSWYDKKMKKPFDVKTLDGMTEEEKLKYKEENVRPVIKFYQVFNAEQCENLPVYELAQTPEMAAEERARQNRLIETVITNSEAPIYYNGGNRAYYSPMSDSIHLPEIKDFKTMQDYYATVLHEIAHSTGHESRLNRSLKGIFGSPDYAREELRAELASVFMQTELGISVEGKHFENHGAYLASWLKAVKDNPKEFYAAASDAEKIADYIGSNYLKERSNSEILSNYIRIEKFASERAYQNDYERAVAEMAKNLVKIPPLTYIGESKPEYATALRQIDKDVNIATLMCYERHTDKSERFKRDELHTLINVRILSEYLKDKEINDVPDDLSAVYIEDKINGIDSQYSGEVRAIYDEIQQERENTKKEIYLNAEQAETLRRGHEILDKRNAADNDIYGIIYNWKGLKEENSIYTGKQLKELDEAFVPEERYDGAIAANKTYMAFRLTGGSEEETERNIRDFLTGKYNEEEITPTAGWYWETVDENFFTGEKNETTREYINRLQIPESELRMKEEPQEPEALSGLEKAQAEAEERGKSENRANIVEQGKQGQQGQQVGQVEKVGQDRYTITIPTALTGEEYGRTRMIRMPKGGEYSSFVLFAPKSMIKQDAKTGEMRLTVRAAQQFVLKNDGLNVELNGTELCAVMEGREIGKSAQRVAPSRRNAQRLGALRENVPEEMKSLPNWCVFRTKWNAEKDKKEKFIISPLDGKWAKSTDAATWTDFETAMKYAEENNCEGLSFALGGGISCIDLDHSVGKDGTLSANAEKLLNEIPETYSETSISDNGIHIFIKDDILAKGKYRNRANTDSGEIEVYDGGRFISMTGKIRSSVRTLGKCPQSTMTWLRQTLGRRTEEQARQPEQRTGTNQSDNEVIERIRRSKKGSTFNTLYNGGDLTGDDSRNDFMLLNILAFFTDCNPEQMARIFKSSGLYRPKKGEPYLNRSINKACSTLSTRISASPGGQFRGRGNQR